MRWTWAILFLAGGRAERRVVVEDFAKAGLWTDTGEVLGLPESIQPPIGTINLTNEGEALRFDYDVAFRALYGAAVLGRTLNGPYDQCANATHVSVKYKIKEPQSRPHLGTLMFSLLDGSDCSGEVCGQGRQGKGRRRSAFRSSRLIFACYRATSFARWSRSSPTRNWTTSSGSVRSVR